MAVTNYKDIEKNLPEYHPEEDYKEVEFGLGGPDCTIRVLQYLSTQGKSNLLLYVIDIALDDISGCFSPIRVNVAYAIGILRSYAGIHFDNDQNIVEAYDTLDRTGIIDRVLGAIPEEERNYMESLVNDTLEDITRYNTSLAGMLQSMGKDSDNLNIQLQEILKNVQDRKGLEILDQIKNVVGTD